MQFLVKSKSKEKTLLDQNNKVITTLKYESTMSSKAHFFYKNDSYLIAPNNAWQTSMYLHKNNQEIGTLEYNWKGVIIIKIKNENGLTKHFILKSANMFASKFNLSDFLTNHLWTIEPKWKWKGFLYEYYFEKEKGFDEEENQVDIVLLFAMTTYGIDLILKMMNAAS